MFSRILFADDGTDLSSQARPHLVALARALQAEVVLVHTVEASPLAGEPGQPVAGVVSSERFDELRAHLNDEGVPNVNALIVSGPPAAAIVAVAEQYECELIVMATRGRSGITRTLAGSVAEDVVRNTHGASVLLVPADEPDE